MDSILVALVSITLRFLISVSQYSGFQKPPMHGDFEAQRHWMEITYNLPVSEWYENNTKNDLMYWGLDYPPLTAYHSWLCGFVANQINATWVELGKSRGIETTEHKFFMRSTVLAADLLIYFPAVFYFFKSCSGLNTYRLWNAALMLLYPGLLLIDHGHFQYNNISLGLALWAIIGILRGRHLWASVAFVLALNYKQMELYHALSFFCYLLASCIHGKENCLWKLCKLGTVVLLTFALCWLPFLRNQASALQVLRRLFPFNRGLYEDKVANVWCSLSPVLKLKEVFDQQTMALISMAATLLCVFPSSIHLLIRPSPRRFLLALAISSLAFFLFSFQVHEKSILLAALPVMLLWPNAPYMCTWFLQVSTFSMLPLLIKDGLTRPYFLLIVLYFIVAKTVARDMPSNTEQVAIPTRILGMLSICGALALSVASQVVPPPAHYPDLWPLLVSAYSCVHFLAFFCYFTYWQCVSEMEDKQTKPVSKPHVQKRVKGQDHESKSKGIENIDKSRAKSPGKQAVRKRQTPSKKKP